MSKMNLNPSINQFDDCPGLQQIIEESLDKPFNQFLPDLFNLPKLESVTPTTSKDQSQLIDLTKAGSSNSEIGNSQQQACLKKGKRLKKEKEPVKNQQCFLTEIQRVPSTSNRIECNTHVHKPRKTIRVFGQEIGSTFSAHRLKSPHNSCITTRHLHPFPDFNNPNITIGSSGPRKAVFTLPLQLEVAPQFISGDFTIVSSKLRICSSCQEDIVFCLCKSAVVEYDLKLSTKLHADSKRCENDKCRLVAPEIPAIHISDGVPFQYPDI